MRIVEGKQVAAAFNATKTLLPGAKGQFAVLEPEKREEFIAALMGNAEDSFSKWLRFFLLHHEGGANLTMADIRTAVAKAEDKVG